MPISAFLFDAYCPKTSAIFSKKYLQKTDTIYLPSFSIAKFLYNFVISFLDKLLCKKSCTISNADSAVKSIIFGVANSHVLSVQYINVVQLDVNILPEAYTVI